MNWVGRWQRHGCKVGQDLCPLGRIATPDIPGTPLRISADHEQVGRAALQAMTNTCGYDDDIAGLDRHRGTALASKAHRQPRPRRSPAPRGSCCGSGGRRRSHCAKRRASRSRKSDVRTRQRDRRLRARRDDRPAAAGCCWEYCRRRRSCGSLWPWHHSVVMFTTSRGRQWLLQLRRPMVAAAPCDGLTVRSRTRQDHSPSCRKARA